MAKRFYIAYGSNLNISQMRRRCPEAFFVGTSVIRDFRLLFRGSKTGSYLTIEPWEGGQVLAAVWEVTPEDEGRLDRYEGWPAFYGKTELTLDVRLTGSGEVRTLTGFVYIMREGRPLGLPSGAYLTACVQGYQSFGFDTAILMEARASSKGETL